MADFKDLLKTRRSIRDFEDKDVSTETVKEIIGETCLAPNAGNQQPWKFVIVNDRATILKLSDDSKKNLLAELEKNPASPVKSYEAVLRNTQFNVFYNAPCLVLIGGAKGTSVDCAIAAGYFMLAAANKGLGTCWIGLGSNIQSPDLLDAMGMTADFQIAAPIILGYPKNIPDIPERMAPQILAVIS